MNLTTVEELINQYRRFKDKYIYVEGYYSKPYLFDRESDYRKFKRGKKVKKILLPSYKHLSVEFCLHKMNRKEYEGLLRIVGIPGSRLHLEANITRIVKLELLDEEHGLIDYFINEKIPLPEELRGKI